MKSSRGVNCFSLFLLLSLIFSSILLAQNTTQSNASKKQNVSLGKRGQQSEANKTIRLKSGTRKVMQKNMQIDFSSKDKRRIFVKLKQSITNRDKKLLQQHGVESKNYVDNNTYIVEVDAEKFDALSKKDFIDGFAELLPEDKVATPLKKDNVASYLKDDHYINVIVYFYDDVNFAEARQMIKTVGAIVKSKKMSFTHKVRIAIPKENIIDLAELEIVKFIEEMSPPISANNINAGKLSNVFWDQDGILTGLFDTDYALTGAGVHVAIEDEGAINHPLFESQRIHVIDPEDDHYHSIYTRCGQCFYIYQ
ncbi:MAG: hypothetical protein RBU23_07250 [Candidatus Auribacterota bacterium]|jgi:hypothetical protein|nr:hypothetical protein [Candidatus Auribacterota bacterium]